MSAVPFQSSGMQKSNSPAIDIVPVTPSDSTDLTYITSGVHLTAGDGTLAVITRNGQTRNITGLALGIVHPIQVKRILATGTGSTGIFAWYS